MGLILTEGFRTNAEVLAGVERLAVLLPDSAFLETPQDTLPTLPGKGITLGSVKTRRAPNAFNFLRQIDILAKGGFDGGSFTEWENTTRIQKAFQIGSREAAAVSNLKDKVPPTVVAQLREDIRPRGMNKWISHEILARDLFNRGFSSGVWLFLERLKGDWDRQVSKTCWTVKEALTLHAVTGAFIFLRNALQAKVPHADFTACIGDINDQTVVSAVESRAQKEIDEKNVEMAEKVSQARLEQIKVHFKQDMETLKQRMPTAEYCEMGRAVVQRLCEVPPTRPKVVYFGLLFGSEGKDSEQALQEKVYKSWDSDPNGPPTTRRRDPVPEPTLQILGWSEQRPFFPESLLQKFQTGTAAHKEVLEMKAALEASFPSAVAVTRDGRSTTVVPRAVGRPDYTIEGGTTPIDPAQAVDLDLIPAASFTEPRLLSVDGSRTKPALFLTTTFQLYIGNTTSEEVTFSACELCGFNVGAYEQKIVAGVGEHEANGLPFRLPNDLALVLTKDRKVLALSDYLHQCATVHGVAEAADGADPVAVPYRYNVSATPSGKCNVFRPTALADGAAPRSIWCLLC
ncbi:FO synthase subunit 1 [Durusdinium trenchii]|uniref:FO synthase subunit 1 n=1 Tax=Durusdinium trenchii TaxID=1381693 RepID=A0ABP0N6P7_9DINO